MISRLKKASIVFWALCGVSFMLVLWGCTQILYNAPPLNSILYIIPDIFIKPFFDPTANSYKTNIVICYLLFAIPVFFACIAVVLRMVAKALDEHSVQVLSLLSEDKK